MPAREQSAVIAFLADPATHGGAPVERVDTHASHIFLAGDRAFKLKRAVRYSYLDYSTPSARERFCRAELALNRRTAPELYLDVRAIGLDPDGRLSFDGTAPALDWVVVMRRFDQDTLFDRMAERGLLTVPMMLDLAGQIARFHDQAAIDRRSGGAAGLAGSFASDARNLRSAVPDALDAAAVEQLITAVMASQTRLGNLLDARRDAGKVRHCHGDLHLRNICLVGGRPTLFDCIEFNPAISNIDVLYDLAFLLMDLHGRGLDVLGNSVFNRYLDLRDESDGQAALPLFLSIRAAVRAHVAVAAFRQQASAQGMTAQARRYLALAIEFLQPLGPQLVAIGGLSGVGKSIVAYGLAPGIGAAPGARVLRSDVTRKRLFGVALEERLPPAAYSEEVTARVYRRIEDEAAQALSAGRSVIADAVFARPAQRAAIAAVAGISGLPFAGIWLEAPPGVLAARIEGRRNDASDATVDVLRRQLTYDLGPIDWQRIEAKAPPDAVLAAVRQALATGG